jgi:hypothetical protein
MIGNVCSVGTGSDVIKDLPPSLGGGSDASAQRRRLQATPPGADVEVQRTSSVSGLPKGEHSERGQHGRVDERIGPGEHQRATGSVQYGRGAASRRDTAPTVPRRQQRLAICMLPSPSS